MRLLKAFKVDVNRLNIPFCSDCFLETFELEDGSVKINVWSAKKTNVELYVTNKTRKFQAYRNKTELEETPCGTFELIPHIQEKKLLLTVAITRSSERYFQFITINNNGVGVAGLQSYKEINESLEEILNEYY